MQTRSGSGSGSHHFMHSKRVEHKFRMTIMQSICEKFIMNLKFDISFRWWWRRCCCYWKTNGRRKRCERAKREVFVVVSCCCYCRQSCWCVCTLHITRSSCTFSSEICAIVDLTEMLYLQIWHSHSTDEARVPPILIPCTHISTHV